MTAAAHPITAELIVAVAAFTAIGRGRDALLYVRAGITPDEAIAMQDAGQQLPDGEQLRVMAVLNGHTLPAGV